MDVINKVCLEVKIGENLYVFTCKSDAPIGEIHDAMYQMKTFVVNRINEQEKLELEQKDAMAKEKQDLEKAA